MNTMPQLVRDRKPGMIYNRLVWNSSAWFHAKYMYLESTIHPRQGKDNGYQQRCSADLRQFMNLFFFCKLVQVLAEKFCKNKQTHPPTKKQNKQNKTANSFSKRTKR